MRRTFRFHDLELTLDRGKLRADRVDRSSPGPSRGRSNLKGVSGDIIVSLVESASRELRLRDLGRHLKRWDGSALNALKAARTAVSRLNTQLKAISGLELPHLVESKGTDHDARFFLSADLKETTPPLVPGTEVPRGQPPGAAQPDILDILDRSRDARHFHILRDEIVRVDAVFIPPTFSILTERGGVDEGEASEFLARAVRILEDDRLLFVIGPYGCGKTVILKRLQLVLLEAGEDTLFINCHQIIDVKTEDLVSAVARRAKGTILTVFLDDFNSVCRVDSDPDEHERRFLAKIFTLLSVPGVRLVLASRALPDEQYTYRVHMTTMFGTPLLDSGRDRFQMIEVQYFSGEQRRAWLAAFADALNEPEPDATLLRYDDIPKDLRPACRNPIFLYMLALRFRADGRFRRVPSQFALYEAFLDRTAAGKFSRVGMMEGALELAAFQHVYRDFLCEVALLIDRIVEERSRNSRQSLLFADDPSEPWITTRQLRDLIATFASKQTPSRATVINRNRLFSGFLSCYFFEQIGRRWAFRDKNIFFFLLAESVWISLERMIDEYESRGIFDEESLQRAARVTLMPATVDFLWDHIADKEAPFGDQLAEVFTALVRQGRLLARTETEQDPAQTRLEVLGVVILLHTKQDGYDTLPQMSAALPHLVGKLRTQEKGQFDALRRGFMGARITQWKLSGCDLSGFNFRNSRLDGVTFVDCLADELELVGTSLAVVELRRCQLRHLTLRAVKGEVLLIDCDVSHLEIDDSSEVDVALWSGSTTKLVIHGDRVSNTRMRVEINGGSVEAVTVSDVRRSSRGRYPQLAIQDARIDHIAINNSVVVVESNVKLPDFVKRGSVDIVDRGSATIFCQRSSDGERWEFALRDAGDERILSSVRFRSREHAVNAIQELRASCQMRERIQIREADARYHFVVRSGRGDEIASSGEYERSSELDAAIRFVRREAVRAAMTMVD